MAAEFQDAPRVAMQVTRGIVVASVQTDLTEPVLARFQDELLSLIHRIGARGVVFDLSGVDLLDSTEFHGLGRILKMAELLGAKTVISGLKPGIVSSLVDSNVDTDGISATLQTDDAIALIRAFREEDVVDEEVDDEAIDMAAIDADTKIDVRPDESNEVMTADEIRDPNSDTKRA
jgi:rsbT antagonist protein RsbS